MSWYTLEKIGWSWATGWNPNYGGYYAQAWRDLPERIRLEDGRIMIRECFIEHGRTIVEAENKLWQRLEQM